LSNHIQHIEITNFKSIRHQKIEGCKRINVFIGYPNVGKSAILEAIAALSYFTAGFNENYVNLCRLKNSHELFYNANIRENINIKSSENLEVEFHYLDENSFRLELDVFSPKRYEYEEYPFESVRRIEYEGLIPINDIYVWNKDRNFPLIKKFIFNNNTASNPSKTNGLLLNSPYGENLVDIVQFNKELRREVGELFKNYNLKLLIDQATNSIRGLKQLDDETIFTVPFYQMADTLQRLIFHKTAIMSNENTVLLFEEPEAHMFPPYIRMFTKDIIFDKGRNNQYFIATHSPVVLSDFLEDAREELAIHLVGYKNGETIVKTLTDNEVNEVYEYGVDLFFNIESYLD